MSDDLTPVKHASNILSKEPYFKRSIDLQELY